MYATKPLSLFKSNPDGRNSGYLVVKGTAEEEGDQTCCWGACRNNRVWELPFPQNRVLTVQYSDDDEADLFVPVPDQPLSSNRYYVVVARGSNRGLVRACSREEDMATCFCRCVKDVSPRPFDPADVYQQIEIVPCKRGLFTARAVAADGFPPLMYGGKGWQVYAYEHSPFYEVTLEQRSETHVGGSAKLARKKAFIGGSVEAQLDAGSRHDGAYVWFRVAASGQRIGVCASVWERMRWLENRGGWVDEEVDGAGTVTGGSVLVERFTVKRVNGSVVVAFDFVHLSKVKARQL